MMLCIHCDQPAHGVCRFCGRALCKEHMQNPLPYIITIYIGLQNTPKAIVVGDALWCMICQPQPQPIEMPELY